VIKAIVTTTINPPSKALHLFAKKKEWKLIIVGDLITPHKLFRDFEKKYDNVTYLSPDDQDKKYPKLSKAIGWKKIQRRNLGYVEANSLGAEIIASVDDDNIPLGGWGEDLLIGKKTNVNYYNTKLDCFDPVGATNYPLLWHRGYPLQLISQREYKGSAKKTVTPNVQADFWNGDPDIDAICRLEHAPECQFNNKFFPMSSNKISPFNSQNTFISREVLKHYFVFPFVGRMDDIWAAYYVQALGFKVVYGKASVFQARNVHNLIKDMKAEYLGYENNLEIVQAALNKTPDKILEFLPKESVESFKIYQKHFK
jgi:hypothetical protein